MSKVLDLAERVVTRSVARISGREVGGLALGFYAGIGIALPLALHRSIAGFIELNVLGSSLAGLVIVAWLAVRVEASHRRHLIEWTTSLRLLDAVEFEWLVGELFRREGWKVRETGGHGRPDGNVDLELSGNGRRAIAQCKRWTARLVGVEDIRGFAGTLLREGLTAKAGFFVTLSGFTPQAQLEAKAMGLTLVDGRELFARIETVRRHEPCPECEMPMTLSRSERGWWLRCVADGCRGKRDLGKDPGRAVELLTRTS